MRSGQPRLPGRRSRAVLVVALVWSLTTGSDARDSARWGRRTMRVVLDAAGSGGYVGNLNYLRWMLTAG
jgi:hypothetical protein